MKNLTLLLGIGAVGAFLGLATACGDSGTGGNGGATSSSSSKASSSSTGNASTSSATTSGNSSSSGMMFPPPPPIGMQIDRDGRPAINTAGTHTFDTDAMTKGAAKDAYNQDSNESMWVNGHTAEIAKNLAILDALDGTCGNQAAAGPNPVAGRYNALAGILADDRLWLKTDAAMQTIYLAVEANAAGLIPNMDGGGRKLNFDVMDESYSLLAIGAPSGVNDNVPADADTMGTAFPYLAGPH